LTKTEFATRLLFWLLPWPISKALPPSLRIYYWGPTGIPPVGFYDYWGQPFPEAIDPFNPPPPDQWPALPDGPLNPSDPYTPGPGPVNPHPSIPSGGWTSCFDNTYWEPRGADPGISWWPAGNYWWASDTCRLYPIGTWAVGFRPTKFRMTFTDAPGDEIPSLYMYDSILPHTFLIFFKGHYTSGMELDCSWQDSDMSRLSLGPGHITNIEFYS